MVVREAGQQSYLCEWAGPGQARAATLATASLHPRHGRHANESIKTRTRPVKMEAVTQ